MDHWDVVEMYQDSGGYISPLSIGFEILRTKLSTYSSSSTRTTLPFIRVRDERSFPKLTLIGTYLNRMLSQDRLSGLSVLRAENERVRKITLDFLVDCLTAFKSRRRQF